LDRLVRSDLKSQTNANWTFSSFGYDLNGNISDQEQNGLEGNGTNNLPNGVVVKAGHKLHSDYDQANWLTQQIDSTLNQRVLNSFTPIGLQSSREIDQITGPGSFNLRQTTTWNYFPNGKLSGLTTTVPSQSPCPTPCTTTQTIESHTVSYLDTNPNFAGTYGVYLDGNRTQDQYSLRPGGSAGSSTTRVAGTASYSYDPRDRLVQNNDGHGDVTTYGLDGAGNVQTQSTVNVSGTTTVSNTYDPNNLVQLQKSTTSGGPTLLYWYDDLGRQQCVTDTTGSRADCNPSENASGNKPLLQDYKYDYLDRLQTYRTYSGGGSPTDEANYVYDALNRTVQETEQHPSFPGDKHITQFSYLGLGGLETEEQQTSKNSGNTLWIKDFTYDVYGHRLAMTVSGSTLPSVPNGTFTYGYDVHGSVSQLVDPNGNTTASYGYAPYGQTDTTLSQGENTDQTNPINPFRYSAKRTDTGSGSLDMGVRRFGPSTAHFLTPDFFYGSLANLSLSTDPLTDNRYDLAGGNPISFAEWDGHMALQDGYGAAATYPTAIDKPIRSIAQEPSKNAQELDPSKVDQCLKDIVSLVQCDPLTKQRLRDEVVFCLSMGGNPCNIDLVDLQKQLDAPNNPLRKMLDGLIGGSDEGGGAGLGRSSERGEKPGLMRSNKNDEG
jgi:RHS repeat-associated protein